MSGSTRASGINRQQLVNLGEYQRHRAADLDQRRGCGLTPTRPTPATVGGTCARPGHQGLHDAWWEEHHRSPRADRFSTTRRSADAAPRSSRSSPAGWLARAEPRSLSRPRRTRHIWRSCAPPDLAVGRAHDTPRSAWCPRPSTTVTPQGGTIDRSFRASPQAAQFRKVSLAGWGGGAARPPAIGSDTRTAPHTEELREGAGDVSAGLHLEVEARRSAGLQRRADLRLERLDVGVVPSVGRQRKVGRVEHRDADAAPLDRGAPGRSPSATARASR